MGRPRFRLHPSTLNPPALSAAGEDAAEEYPPWVLLELKAFVAERENATTARSKTWDNKDIQVTIFPRRPPCVSYLCVYSRDAEMPLEPEVLAMEDDLILLRVTVSCQKDILKNIDYYVYQAADGAAGWKPSLTLLQRPPGPPYSFYSEDIGIMRRGTSHQPRPAGESGNFSLRPHRRYNSDDDFYVVAGLVKASAGNFVLCLFNSKKGCWSANTVSLNQEQKQHYGSKFQHANSKVIPIGGDVGTMGFVDLWRGILFCDMLPVNGEGIPPLRYVALPPTLLPNRLLSGDARLSRDIAVVKGRLRYIELQVHWKDSKIFRGHILKDGWMAATWSRPATSHSLDDGWRKDCEVDSNKMNFKNNRHVELLPKVLNDEDIPLPPFKRVDICQPTLGLHDDDNCDIVYFMTKVNREDEDAWVIAMDMKKKELQGVAQFAAARTRCITFAYVHSRISKHLLKSAP